MAQEVKVVLLCDRCESRNEAETTETFAAGGQSYEVDLCKKHKGELDKALSGWVGISRRAGRVTAGVTRRRQRGAAAGPAQPAYNEDHARAWALAQGLNVKPEGRLSPTTIGRWREAGSPAA